MGKGTSGRAQSVELVNRQREMGYTYVILIYESACILNLL